MVDWNKNNSGIIVRSIVHNTDDMALIAVLWIGNWLTVTITLDARSFAALTDVQLLKKLGS